MSHRVDRLQAAAQELGPGLGKGGRVHGCAPPLASRTARCRSEGCLSLERHRTEGATTAVSSFY